MRAAEFINLFKTGSLGKKRQHAGYRVMDGENCQLLVRATRRYGVPGGGELIGIYFGHDVCIFHNNFNRLRDSVTNDVQSPKPVFNSGILKESDEHLIESGIIGFDDTKGLLLLELGETPWLLEQDAAYKPGRYSTWEWSYNTATQVSRRVASVEEAVKDTVLPEGVLSNLGYLLKALPSNFVPLSTSEEDTDLLMQPPNPFDYGLKLEDLIVQPVYARGGSGCTPLYVKDKVIRSPRGAQFKTDASAFNKATERFNNREPSYWEELTSNETGTVLLGANEQVYLKGHVYHRYQSSEKADFPTWHQVLGKSTKLRIPIR